MEEKINNKRIFSYVPSLIAKIILESELKDEDVFFRKNGLNRNRNTIVSPKHGNKYNSKVFERHASILTNPEIFPIEYPLPHSIIMSVKLKGFQELILSLGINDPKRQKVKLHCEYLPILTSKILLQISSIITENGGEILKMDDFEFYAIWDFSNIDIKLLPIYQYFYSKHAIISAYDIMKKVDNTEIIKGYKITISIGLAYGETSLFFFGGERRRSDFVLMGEAIEESEHCLHLSGPHEILIGREMNNFFKGKGEIATDQVGTDDRNKNIYKINIDNTDEYELKNFQDFKNIKLNSNYIAMNQKVYQNLSKKVYMLSSVLPQGLVKYLDIGEDANLKEISIITIMTVHIVMDLDLIDNSRQIQYLVKDMQKSTYLTRGSLLGVIKTFNGLMIRCAWGLEPNTFVDETGRAISSAFAMKKLTNIYKIKIGIGIATGCCFTGLINIQGNRKMYSLLGYKAIISRLLADKANRKIMRNKNNTNILDDEIYSNKFIVYCDKATMKYSQKWFRHNYISDLFYMLNESKNDENNDDSINKEINNFKKKSLSVHKESKKNKNSNKIKKNKTINNKGKNSKNLHQINNNLTELDNNKEEGKDNNDTDPKLNVEKIGEIYTPIEYDEYFFQTNLDPFPLIRTYKYNSHNRKVNTYSFNNYLNNNVKNEDDKINNSNNNLQDMNMHLNKINIVNNDINDVLPTTRNTSRTVYIKRKIVKKVTGQGLSEEKIRSYNKKLTNKFERVDSRYDSIKMKETIKKKTRKEEKNIYTMMKRLSFNKNKSKDYKSLLKLKKSQNIIGVHNKVILLLKHMNRIYIDKEKQFFLVRGPLGIGKSLFMRKVLNNFIGLNDTLGTHYFNTNYQFLFCNILNPFSTILPYNTIAFILRKIYLLLKLDNKLNDVLSLLSKLSINNFTIKNINFILSMGRNDINLLNEFNFFKSRKKSKLNIKKVEYEFENNNIFKYNTTNYTMINYESIIIQYEGPFIYDNTDKINNFFYEMIKIYMDNLKSKTNKFILPLIFLLDDIQLSDKYSIGFIEFLFNKIINDKNNNDLNPFIFIMIQQTPFNNKYRSLNPIDLDKFLNNNITLEYDKNYENKIICLDIKPTYDKNILKKIIIFHFKNSVFKQYATELKVVDNKILDFLLSKTFNGIPFLVINLLKSLIDSDKFIQNLSGELIITSELTDESDIMDWHDILIPYIYEKITSNSINKILNFREILILKYASIIGTIFDIKTLDKINPLNSIIKIEDIIILIEKLNKEYFAELYNNDFQVKKNKLICQITFPFLREALYQKFLIEARAPLHMKLAGIISMAKRIIYFSLDDEIKLLKKHLFNSEINIINELKIYKTEIKTIKDILQSKKDLSFNNLKILLIKEICHNFYRYQLDNLLDGNLEMYNSEKSNWIRVYYIINTKKIIFYNQEDEKMKKEERHPILILGLNSIYRNELSTDYFNKTKSNILEICVSEEGPIWARGFVSTRRKKEYFFSSEKIKDVYQLEIGINFLKMKVNYDTFIGYYGSTRFPLYKLKWFVKKEEKYFFDSGNSFNLWNINNKSKTKKKKNSFISIEKLIDKSKECSKPFTIIIKSALGLVFGLIQEKISKNKINNCSTNDSLYIQTPSHLKKSLNKLFFLEKFTNNNNINRNNDINNKKNNNKKYNNNNNEKKNDLNKSNFSINNNIEDIVDSNIKSMKNNNNNISINDSFASSKISFDNSFNINNNNKNNNNNNNKNANMNKNNNIKKDDNNTNKIKNKSNIDFSLKLSDSIDNYKFSNSNNNHINYTEFIKIFPNTVKNENHMKLQEQKKNPHQRPHHNQNKDNKNKKENNLLIPKISFPKNPSLQVNKKEIEEDDEPLFTESNFNTSNNASLINGNDSTKLTCSTNKKSVSQYGEKDNLNLNMNININKNETNKNKKKIKFDDNIIDSIKGIKTTKNKSNKKINLKIKNKEKRNKPNIKIDTNTNTITPFDINEKIKNEKTKTKRNRSRNNRKNNLEIRSYDNKYEKTNKRKELEKDIKKKIDVLSYDDIYKKRRKGRMPGDFVPFKSKKETKIKHVNVISSDDSFDEPQIKIYPIGVKFSDIKSIHNLKHKKLSES